MTSLAETIIQGDCIAELAQLPDKSVDLVFFPANRMLDPAELSHSSK